MQLVLLKLSFIYALCQMIILPEKEALVLKNVEQAAWNALVASHGTIPFKKLRKLTIKLNQFCSIMKWEQCNLQGAINFSILLLEDVLFNTNDVYRKALLQTLMDSLNSAYFFFSGIEGERYDMIEEGIKAVAMWTEMIE